MWKPQKRTGQRQLSRPCVPRPDSHDITQWFPPSQMSTYGIRKSRVKEKQQWNGRPQISRSHKFRMASKATFTHPNTQYWTQQAQHRKLRTPQSPIPNSNSDPIRRGSIDQIPPPKTQRTPNRTKTSRTNEWPTSGQVQKCGQHTARVNAENIPNINVHDRVVGFVSTRLSGRSNVTKRCALDQGAKGDS